MLILRYYHFFVLFNCFLHSIFHGPNCWAIPKLLVIQNLIFFPRKKTPSKPKIAVKSSSHEFCMDLQFWRWPKQMHKMWCQTWICHSSVVISNYFLYFNVIIRSNEVWPFCLRFLSVYEWMVKLLTDVNPLKGMFFSLS